MIQLVSLGGWGSCSGRLLLFKQTGLKGYTVCLFLLCEFDVGLKVCALPILRFVCVATQLMICMRHTNGMYSWVAKHAMPTFPSGDWAVSLFVLPYLCRCLLMWRHMYVLPRWLILTWGSCCGIQERIWCDELFISYGFPLDFITALDLGLTF